MPAPADASGTRYWLAGGTAQTNPPLNSGTAYCKPPTSCQGHTQTQEYSGETQREKKSQSILFRDTVKAISIWTVTQLLSFCLYAPSQWS